MSGGLMQLVAYGAQDIYLTGNAHITFFKVVYRRHTNFSMESIEQTFNGAVDFGKKLTVTVARNGDLLTKAF
jgi:collagenase-like PrtC family protease